MKIQGITITHPDKILYPEANISKLDIVNYYKDFAGQIMPYLKGRPLTLRRFPDGVDKQGFFQKNASDYFPDFIKTIEVKTDQGKNTTVVCNNLKTLLYLANQGTIEFHVWLSRMDKLNKPDKVVFDLDPPSGSFKTLKKGANVIRDFLAEEGIHCQLTTSGKNGLHLWYSKRRTKTFDESREEVKNYAQTLASLHPDLLTTEMRKEDRDGKIFIDYPRNSYGQTTICPYSLRATDNASIATLISWDDLPKLKSAQDFHLKNISKKRHL